MSCSSERCPRERFNHLACLPIVASRRFSFWFLIIDRICAQSLCHGANLLYTNALQIVRVSILLFAGKCTAISLCGVCRLLCCCFCDTCQRVFASRSPCFSACRVLDNRASNKSYIINPFPRPYLNHHAYASTV